jgi:hypothetical protein
LTRTPMFSKVASRQLRARTPRSLCVFPDSHRRYTTPGLPMPAFAAAVPMSMKKPMRQLAEEIMGDHRSTLVRAPVVPANPQEIEERRVREESSESQRANGSCC